MSHDEENGLSTPEYAGPNKVDAALGGAVSSAAINAVGTGVIGAAVGAMFKNTGDTATLFSEKVLTGGKAGAYTGAKWAGLVGAALGTAYGAYTGMREHDEAVNQLEKAHLDKQKAERDLTREKTFVEVLLEGKPDPRRAR